MAGLPLSLKNKNLKVTFMKKLFFAATLFLLTAQSYAQTPPPIKVPGGVPDGAFKTNTVFEKGKPYFSQDKRYFLVFQEDGNLVLYKYNSKNNTPAIWQTRTHGIAMKSCVFQEDGNLVLYDYSGKARWAANGGSVDKGGSGSGDKFYPKGPGSHWMNLQNDGNLVIYVGQFNRNRNNPRWSTGTFEKN